jgi:DNA-binding CsgD family transcriptional regulator
VARALALSPKTVGNHLQAAYAQAGISTQAGATFFAMQHGLLDAELG